MTTILLTNDDGLHAEGLRVLRQIVAPLGRIVIVAPEKERSGASMGVTMYRPLLATPSDMFEDSEAWSVSGTPVDCIKLALSTLLDAPPDLVLSGINRGGNSGLSCLYSGTVAAAVESAIRGIPAMALSCVGYDHPNYEQFFKILPPLLAYVADNPPPKGTCLNVNGPALDQLHLKHPRGVRFARQGRSYWTDACSSHQHPTANFTYHWLGGRICREEESSDSDTQLLEAGYATVVPLNLTQLTDDYELERMRLAAQTMELTPG